MQAVSAHDIDLAAYFRRIKYAGAAAPTLATLRTLHALHTEALPFENLDPLLGRIVQLDLASIEAKLVRGRRGGYCYEHNLLFSHVLERLGFSVRRLAARVLWDQPRNSITQRSHMLMLVRVDGTGYIADPGFGGHTLTGPVVLEDTQPQDTPHGAFRLSPVQGGYLLEGFLQQQWQRLYSFDLSEQFPIDYEAVNYYQCTHPSSHFRYALYAALAGPHGRLSLLNDKFTLVRPDGTVQHETLHDARQALQVLDSHFGIAVPDTARLQAIWPRLREPVRPSDPAD